MQGYWAAGKFQGSGTLVFMLGDYQAKYDGSWIQGYQVSSIGFSCYLKDILVLHIAVINVFLWSSHGFLISFSLIYIGFSLDLTGFIYL